jgi:hypothetical protein
LLRRRGSLSLEQLTFATDLLAWRCILIVNCRSSAQHMFTPIKVLTFTNTPEGFRKAGRSPGEIPLI